MKSMLIFFMFYIPTVYASLLSNRYKIQLKSNSTITGVNQNVHAMQKELNACLKSNGIKFLDRRKISRIISGRSITLDDDFQRDILSKCPQIEEILPQRSIPAPRAIEGGPIKPLEFFTHRMTGVEAVKTKLGLTGKGIKVGIIDTGIDYTHPAFGACSKIGSPGCAVKFGYDFVGDNFVGTNDPVPDDDPLDKCVGHGTHVAGILAGNDIQGSVLGVAPNVELGIYRVFGCKGGTTSDLLISAMRRAYKDGMDIINLSLGGDAGFADSPESLVVEELTKLGVIFSIAVGNAGEDGIWMASNPSVSSYATAVTSFDNSQGIRRTFKLRGAEDKNIVFAYNLIPSSPPDPRKFRVELVADIVPTHDEGSIATDMCSDPVVDVKGKLVLLTNGNCGIKDKALILRKAGALGIVLANNRPGDIGPLQPSRGIPIFTISEEDGHYLARQIAAKIDSVMIFSERDTVVDLPTGGKVSTFSTWGLAPNLDIKPDFGAPGGFIFSAYPRNLGSYAVLSGTSMATPYIAGCYALYLENINRHSERNMKYKTDPILIREIISIYSSAIDQQADSSQENAVPISKQGGGLIQLDRALFGRSRVSPAKLSIGLLPMTSLVSLKLINYDSVVKQYTIRIENAATVDIGDPNRPRILKSFADGKFTEDGINYVSILVIKVLPKSTAEFYCWFGADKGAEASATSQFFISGFVEITPRSSQGDTFIEGEGDYVMSVPFSGMQGDLSQRRIFDMTSGVQPSIEWTRYQNGDVLALGKSTQATLPINNYNARIDSVVVRWRQLIPLQTLSLDVYSSDGSKYLGNAMTSDRLGRNGNSPEDVQNYLSDIKWNTSYTDENGELQFLENGIYMLKLSYKTVQLINTAESIKGSIILPLINIQWTEESKVIYDADMNTLRKRL